jgi:hypothetical protein
MEDATGECPILHVTPHPYLSQPTTGFYSNICNALFCSLCMYNVGSFKGVRKGRVLRKKIVNFPPPWSPSLHSLKTLMIPFSFAIAFLFVQTCRDWICLWCSLVPSSPIVCAYVYGAAIYEDDSPILRYLLIYFLFSKMAYILAKTFPENVHRLLKVYLCSTSQRVPQFSTF